MPALARRIEDQERTRRFERHRPRLRGIAYRMLGSLSDAEDIVQEACLRWRAVDLATIRSAEAWLVTATTRLAIDRLRAIAAERRAYVGAWLPEPWAGERSTTARPRDGTWSGQTTSRWAFSCCSSG